MRALSLLVAVVLVAGCAATPRAPVVPGAVVDPERLTEWTATGRLAIAADGQGGSGTFVWQQRAAATELTLRGPLGSGALRILRDGESLSVSDGEGRSLDAAQAREQIRARLGTDLPLDQLRFWMLGLAAPGIPAEVSDRREVPVRVIDQSGWRVSYEQFIAAQGWSLPARMTAASGAVRIRVVVNEWRAQPAGGSPTLGPRP